MPIPVTNQQLLNALKELTPEQLKANATILMLNDDGEFELHNVHDTLLASELEDAIGISDELQENIMDALDSDDPETHPLLVNDQR